MSHRRVDPRCKSRFLNSYATAQEGIRQRAINAQRISKVPYGGFRKSNGRVQFGDWRLSPQTIIASKRVDENISQVAQMPQEAVPKSLFVDAPHVKAILDQSKALSESIQSFKQATCVEENLSKEIEVSSPPQEEKLKIFAKIFTEVISEYQAHAVAEFIRQERTWVDALHLCVSGIWKHPDKNKRNAVWKYSRTLETPAEVCLSKCSKGDRQAFFSCHRMIQRHGVHVPVNALLSGLSRSASRPGEFWNIALETVSKLPAVREKIEQQQTLKKQTNSKKIDRNIDQRAGTFALLIANLGYNKQSAVLQVMDFIDDHFPEIHRSPAIWTAYFSSRACGWEECVKIYNTNLSHLRVQCDTPLFDALIHRCVDAGALDTAREIHKAMRSKGVPESLRVEDQGEIHKAMRSKGVPESLRVEDQEDEEQNIVKSPAKRVG